jgi:hypothetical protein
MSQFIFNKRLTPPIPDLNKVSVYVKPDGELYMRKDSGVEVKVSGKASMKIEARLITAAEAAQKFLVLQAIPSEPENISLIIGHGGGTQIKGLGFDISGENNTVLYWDGKALDGFIEEGDVFLLHYLTIV